MESFFIPSAGTNGQVWTSDGDGVGGWSDVSANKVAITDNENTNETNALIFSSDGDIDGGEMNLESDGDANYNPSTGVIRATGFNSETVVASSSVDITGANGLILENDETITNSTDGTILLTATTTSLSGDLTVTGNDIVFGNEESISNSTNGTVVVTATTIETAGKLAVGDGSSSGQLLRKGDYDITLQTGNSTTGSITITDGANGNIAIAPNGSGVVQIDGLSWPAADGSANQVLKTDGSGRLSWGDAISSLTGAGSTIDTEDLTASRAIVSDGSGKIAAADVTSTELGYLDGVTSNVQTQLDAKQASDTDLAAIAALDNSDGNIIVGSASGWVAESGATARTSLGLGTISTQASDNVALTGGTIDGAAIGATTASTGAFSTLSASGATDLNSTLNTSGNVSLDGSANELRFYEGSNYVGFEAPSLSSDQIWTLPTADGSANQVLKTDGSGALAWTDVSATTVTISDNENTSETNALVFTSGGDVDGGSMGLESDGDATYNPSTGVIGATGFSGATVVASTSVDITGSTGLILENDETITNSTDGTVLINGTVSGGTGVLREYSLLMVIKM